MATKRKKKLSPPSVTWWHRRQQQWNRECRAAARKLTREEFYNPHTVLREIAKEQGAKAVSLHFMYEKSSGLDVTICVTKKAQRQWERRQKKRARM